jgi:hypothetical protein
LLELENTLFGSLLNRVSLLQVRLSFDSQIDSQQGKLPWTLADIVWQEPLNLSPVTDTSGYW